MIKMKEIIRNKWIIVFVVMVIGVFYIGSDTPKTFEEINDEQTINVNA